MRCVRAVLTGRPGVGKTTMIKMAVKFLNERNVRVEGFYTEEVRDTSGKRVGFDVVDIASGERFGLARKGVGSTYAVGRYGVLLELFDSYLADLEKNIFSADFIVVDELGPMEFLSKRFAGMMKKVAEKECWVVTHHFKASNHNVVRMFRERANWICELTVENRDTKAKEFIKLLRRALAK